MGVLVLLKIHFHKKMLFIKELVHIILNHFLMKQILLLMYILNLQMNYLMYQKIIQNQLLISAGTGFAPMRSFLQERKARNAPGENYVFFGCRNENTDLLYCDEMEKYRKEGLITGWFKAYSRSSKYPKEYIQVKILEQADLLWDAI